MKANTLIPLLGLSGTALSAAVAKNNQEPWGYKSGSKESIANLKDKVENVVWILLENRGFDNILGGVHKEGLDNVVNNGPFCNPQSVNQTHGQKWCSVNKDYDSVIHDPDHSVTGVNFELYGTYNPSNKDIASGKLKPNLNGFVEKQMISYPSISAKRATEEVMGYYTESEIPTLVDLVDEFTTFNYWHSCVPGVSTSQTSALRTTSETKNVPAHQPQPPVRNFRNPGRPRRERR
jgi:phospholipase C